MRTTFIASFFLVALAGFGLAQVVTPLKAKAMKGELVTAYEPCTAPNTFNPSSIFTLACTPPVRSNPTCGFGPNGKGKYSIKLFGSDLKVTASLTGLAGCLPNGSFHDLALAANFRITTTACAADCTTANAAVFVGGCELVDGKCTIKSTLETTHLANALLDGETYNIELGDICVHETINGKAFCNGIKVSVPAPPTTSTSSTSTTTVSTTSSTTLPCPGTGVFVGGACWYLGAPGADCDNACTNEGLVYDPATKSYAGSDGTDANCQAVYVALGGPNSFLGNTNTGGMGCFDYGGAAAARDTDPTTSNANLTGFKRVCACQ